MDPRPRARATQKHKNIKRMEDKERRRRRPKKMETRKRRHWIQEANSRQGQSYAWWIKNCLGWVDFWDCFITGQRLVDWCQKMLSQLFHIFKLCFLILNQETSNNCSISNKVKKCRHCCKQVMIWWLIIAQFRVLKYKQTWKLTSIKIL